MLYLSTPAPTSKALSGALTAMVFSLASISTSKTKEKTGALTCTSTNAPLCIRALPPMAVNMTVKWLNVNSKESSLSFRATNNFTHLMVLDVGYHHPGVWGCCLSETKNSPSLVAGGVLLLAFLRSSHIDSSRSFVTLFHFKSHRVSDG